MNNTNEEHTRKKQDLAHRLLSQAPTHTSFKDTRPFIDEMVSINYDKPVLNINIERESAFDVRTTIDSDQSIVRSKFETSEEYEIGVIVDLENFTTTCDINEVALYHTRYESLEDMEKLCLNNFSYETLFKKTFDLTTEASFDFGYYLLNNDDNEAIRDSALLSTAKSLPEGWVWTSYDDGSGGLKSPEGLRYCSYDLFPSEICYEPRGIEKWDHVYGLSANYKDVGEKYIRTQVLKIEDPEQELSDREAFENFLGELMVDNSEYVLKERDDQRLGNQMNKSSPASNAADMPTGPILRSKMKM